MIDVIFGEHLCFALGHHQLLDNTEFRLKRGEHLGLIGRNGTGKSSFLKILAGLIPLDDGDIRFERNLSIVYIAQQTILDPTLTIRQTIAKTLDEEQALLNEYQQQQKLLSQYPENTEILAKIQELQLKLDICGSWQIEQRISELIDQFNLPADTMIHTLSGGQKKKVQLAQAWIKQPDVLLLDEPTNHLDIDHIIWLEELLREFNGALVVITHDRYFLDHVATRIVELDRGILRSYPGNFAVYQERKTQELAVEENLNREFDKFYAQEEIWIRKGIKARRTRNEGRVKRLKALRNERNNRKERQGKIHFHCTTAQKSGKIVAELNNVSFAYDAHTPIIANYSTMIKRGDKIGLVGPNGSGKSTFLRLVLGEIEPTSGHIQRGNQLSLIYFDQFRNQLNDNDTVFDTIGDGKDTVLINEKSLHVISYLEDFLFPPQRLHSPVAALSGGEKNRLLLAKLFTKPANIIILDEPTNDLDIETQQVLEDLLNDFTGTVFLVSHDRAFLDAVTTQVILFQGDGLLADYIGDYHDYQVRKKYTNKHKITSQPLGRQEKKNKNKLSQGITSKEKKELTALPQEIERLEAELNGVQQALLEPNIFKDNYAQAHRYQQQIYELEQQIENKFSRWNELENKINH